MCWVLIPLAHNAARSIIKGMNDIPFKDSNYWRPINTPPRDFVLLTKDRSLVQPALAVMQTMETNAEPLHGMPAESLVLVALQSLCDGEWCQARFRILTDNVSTYVPWVPSEPGSTPIRRVEITDFSTFEQWHTVSYAVAEFGFPEAEALKLI